jgi:hypothetical protein
LRSNFKKKKFVLKNTSKKREFRNFPTVQIW